MRFYINTFYFSLDWKSFQDYAKSIVQNAISKSASPSKSGDPVTPIGILFKQMINSKEPVMKIRNNTNQFVVNIYY